MANPSDLFDPENWEYWYKTKVTPNQGNKTPAITTPQVTNFQTPYYDPFTSQVVNNPAASSLGLDDEAAVNSLLSAPTTPASPVTNQPTQATSAHADYWDAEGYLWTWYDNGMGDQGYIRGGYDPSRATKGATAATVDPTQLPTTPAPAGYTWYWDGNQYALRETEPSTTDDEMTAWQKAQAAAQTSQDAWTQQYQQRQLDMEQQRFQWEQQQAAAQLEAKRQEQLATLRANPSSWLEYASLSNQTPLVQPWMVPLTPDQYGWKGAQVGSAIPNWDATKDQTSLQGNLPSLLNPAAQYMSRIAPSARQQYYGYQKATTGATPEDSQWKLWSMGAPGGANTGVNYSR